MRSVSELLLPRARQVNPSGVRFRDCKTHSLEMSHPSGEGTGVDPSVPICHKLRAAPRVTSHLSHV